MRSTALCRQTPPRSTLVTHATGPARDIVKDCQIVRNGVRVWVRLRDRFGKTTGATSFTQVFSYPWARDKPFEDLWREWVRLVSRLPRGSLGGGAFQALAIQGVHQAKQSALEAHLRLNSPMEWDVLLKQVDSYLATLTAADDVVPMDIDEVSKDDTANECYACGKAGHETK